MCYVISIWRRYSLGLPPHEDGWVDTIMFAKEDQAVECQQLVEYMDGIPTKVRRKQG